MPVEHENHQQAPSDNPAPARDSHTESAALQVSASESSDFNLRQRDDIKASTSQMVESGKLPELSLHNTANNGSIGVEGSRPSAELKNGIQDKAIVQRGEGPYNVAERLLGDNASNSDIKDLTGALKSQYRDETNNKDFMMNNLKVGHELLTDKNVNQVLSKIADPEARQRISERLTKDSAPTDHSSEEASKSENNNGKEHSKQKHDKNNSASNHRNGEQADQDSKPERDRPSARNDQSPDSKEDSVDRSQFDKELSNPDVMAAFAGRMRSEVGSQGPAAQLAFAEEVMNRAASRDQTIMQALHGSYYPTHNPGRSTNPDYTEAITKAWKEGTDTIDGGTGNASATVGFGAGKARYNADRELVAPNQTASINGERFGMEQVDLDRGWKEKYEQLKNKI